MTIRRDEFAAGVLVGLELPVTRWAVIRLTGWMYGESGPRPCTGNQFEGARYNPLNTTLKRPGSTDYNDVPVQSYVNAADGIVATVFTLTESPEEYLYDAVVRGLRRRIFPFARPVGLSHWGTGAQLVRDGIGAVQNVPSRGMLELG